MKAELHPFPTRGNNRRIDIKIDKFDTWNCDDTLAYLIYPMLCQLRDTKHGVPGDFCDVAGSSSDSQMSFEFYEDTYEDAFDEACKDWYIVLDKMIWSFEQLIHNDYSDKYHHGNGEYEFEKSDITYPNPVTGKLEATYKMVDLNPGEHWVDYVGLQMHEARMQEGFELFGKYFRNLWD